MSARFSDRTVQAAARWYARLHAFDCTPGEREEFERWRSEDPSHAAAYAAALEIASLVRRKASTNARLRAMTEQALAAGTGPVRAARLRRRSRRRCRARRERHRRRRGREPLAHGAGIQRAGDRSARRDRRLDSLDSARGRHDDARRRELGPRCALYPSTARSVSAAGARGVRRCARHGATVLGRHRRRPRDSRGHALPGCRGRQRRLSSPWPRAS